MTPRSSAEKRMSSSAAAHAAAAWRAAGESVLLARVDADLLHAALARRLARGPAERVIAAVADDATFTAETGTVPLFPAEARATLIGALRAVDAVVVFEAGAWRELERAIVPSAVLTATIRPAAASAATERAANDLAAVRRELVARVVAGGETG